MLSKRKRLDKTLFNETMKKGVIIHGQFFVFRYLRQKTQKYAFIVPKNLAKSAVLRNKLRRKGYNILKTIDLPLGVGIFFYKKIAIPHKNLDFKGDILNVLKKI